MTSTIATTPTCNHTSVGAIIQEENMLLLIERKKFSWGFACPAGHVDDEELEAAAALGLVGEAAIEEAFKRAIIREVQEETGKHAFSLEFVIDMVVANACRRPGGSWHHWRVYRARTVGNLIHNQAEAKAMGWYSLDRVRELAQRTEAYRAGRVSEEEWQQSPGLEGVWYDFLKLARVL